MWWQDVEFIPCKYHHLYNFGLNNNMFEGVKEAFLWPLKWWILVNYLLIAQIKHTLFAQHFVGSLRRHYATCVLTSVQIQLFIPLRSSWMVYVSHCGLGGNGCTGWFGSHHFWFSLCSNCNRACITSLASTTPMNLSWLLPKISFKVVFSYEWYMCIYI